MNQIGVILLALNQLSFRVAEKVKEIIDCFVADVEFVNEQ